MLRTNTDTDQTILFYNSIQFRYFFIILTLFSGTWLISDISAVKLVSIFGITLTGGFIVFPFTTMLSSVIVEVYGYKNARQAIWAGFLLNLSFVFFINLVNIIPASPYWNLGKSFQSILVPESRIIFASLFSFVLSDFANSYFMAKMKIKTQGKSLTKRLFISCGLSISIDIFCFMTIAFLGTMPSTILMKLMIAAYIKKLLCQLILLPVIFYLINKLKAAEHIEIYDYETKFNPFSVDNIYEFSCVKKPDTEQKNLQPLIQHNQ